MLGDCVGCWKAPDECSCIRDVRVEVVNKEVSLEQLVTEVKVLRLQPGDVLVLKSDKLLSSHDTKDLLQNAAGLITKFVGFRVPVVVIPEDAEVEVLRSGDGTTLLPHQKALDDALVPVPTSMGTTGINIIKSKTPGPLSGLIAAAATEDKGDG
jgi:hypothetical protein